MSIIEEALHRLQQQQQRQSGDAAATVGGDSGPRQLSYTIPRPPRRHLALILAAGILLGIGLSVWSDHDPSIPDSPGASTQTESGEDATDRHPGRVIRTPETAPQDDTATNATSTAAPRVMATAEKAEEQKDAATPPRSQQTAAPIAITASTASSRNFVSSARLAEQAGRLDEALVTLKKGLQESPHDDKARLMLGRLLVEQGHYRRAQQTLAPLFERNVKTWQAWFWMGSCYLGLQQLDNAARYLDEALARNSGQAQIWVQRAVVAQQLNQHDQALRLLASAERIDAEMPEVQINIAYSNDILGNMPRAVAAYQKFLQLTQGVDEFISERRTVLQRLKALSQ